MAWLQLVAGMVGFCAYLPLIAGILRDTARQSFAAFFLWALLDSIAAITTFLQGGNYWLPFSNVVGSSAIAALLVVKRQVAWSWIESMTAVLVMTCLCIWYTAGEVPGIVASSMAVVIASIPQMAETFRHPQTTPVGAYLIFLAANILSFLAGRAWSVEERFYAACSIFLCAVIVLLALRKKVF